MSITVEDLKEISRLFDSISFPIPEMRENPQDVLGRLQYYATMPGDSAVGDKIYIACAGYDSVGSWVVKTEQGWRVELTDSLCQDLSSVMEAIFA